MYTKAEILALKTSVQVGDAITATAGNAPYASSNSDVASNLSLARWLVVLLRQYYNKTRI